MRIFCLVVCFTLTSCDAAPSPQVEAAKRGVTFRLAVPDSAKFRDLRVCSGDKEVVAGEYSAMNRMGVQLGYEFFFAEGSKVAFAGEPLFNKFMSRCYSNLEIDGFDTSSSWSTASDTNPIDDTVTMTASIDADPEESSDAGFISLIIRCRSNETDLFVNWNDYLGDDSRDVYSDWKLVTVRVGDEDAKEQRWGISTDSKATFAPGSPIALIRRMALADRIVLRTTPYNESPVTAVFKLAGMREAVAPIAEECNWTF